MEYLINYVFNDLSDDLFEKMFEIENGVIKTSNLCDLLIAFIGVSLSVSICNLIHKGTTSQSGTLD